MIVLGLLSSSGVFRSCLACKETCMATLKSLKVSRPRARAWHLSVTLATGKFKCSPTNQGTQWAQAPTIFMGLGHISENFVFLRGAFWCIWSWMKSVS